MLFIQSQAMPFEILQGDCRVLLPTLPAKSVATCITSPPYLAQRDYDNNAQIGLERNPASYVAALVQVFRQVRRVLRDDGTLWLVMGDTYANKNKAAEMEYGVRPKNLLGIPWRVAFGLQDDGWYLRSDIIWHKPSPLTEPVKDRPTRSHEYIFLFSKRARYYYDAAAVMEPKTCNRRRGTGGSRLNLDTNRRDRESLAAYGNADLLTGLRNKRSVWKIAPSTVKGVPHTAMFPPELIRPCIRAGSPPGGIVLDCFAGAGTTGLVCRQEGRQFIGIELNTDYVELARRRIGELK